MKTKLLAIGTLGLLSVLSLGKSFYNVNAAVTDWDFAYKYDSSSARFEFTDAIRGASGIRAPWTNPSANNYHLTINAGAEVVEDEPGLPVKFHMRVAYPDSAFVSDNGFYYPPTSVDNISSDEANTANKLIYQIDNPSFDRWVNIALDWSYSQGTSQDLANLYIVQYGVYQGTNAGPYLGGVDAVYPTMASDDTPDFILSPRSTIYITMESNSEDVAFTGFYVKTLNNTGIPTYQEGYDAGFGVGYTDGYTDGADATESNVTSRIGVLIGTVFNGVGSLFDIKIFDDLTIGSVLLFPLAFVIFTFMFRIIRGGKA